MIEKSKHPNRTGCAIYTLKCSFVLTPNQVIALGDHNVGTLMAQEKVGPLESAQAWDLIEELLEGVFASWNKGGQPE